MTPAHKTQKRETWQSRFGFILAAAGWSLGLGNIWRFPYVTGQYGGGAFVAIYLLALIVIAIPLFTLEFSLGRSSKSSITTGYRQLAPGRLWFIGGWFGIMATILILSYYVMLMGWVLAYLVKTLSASYFNLSPELIAAHFDTFAGTSGLVILWEATILITLGIIVARGLVRGIETFSKFAMPVLFLMLIGLGFYALTLPGAAAGLKFYLKPDLAKLSVEAVLVAVGQVFLSIGVGFGATWVYGSYLDQQADIPSDSITIAGLDTLGALLAGFIIFPAVFTFGVSPESGQRLIFVTLPAVFAQMSGGSVFGGLFFFLVFVAATTSAIASLECISSWLMDELQWDRSKTRVRAVWTVVAGIFILSLPTILSQGPWAHIRIFGLDLFALVDTVSANILLVLSALAMALYAGWSIGVRRLAEMTNEGARRMLVGPVWGVVVKFAIPLIIISLFIANLW